MKKEELIKFLDKTIAVEELAFPIYSRHFDTALFWSGITKENKKIIEDHLNVMIIESKKHIQLLQTVKK